MEKNNLELIMPWMEDFYKKCFMIISVSARLALVKNLDVDPMQPTLFAFEL